MVIKDDFQNLLVEIWSKDIQGATNIKRWQNKICRPRQFLRGWAKNLSGAYKKEKARLIAKADELDKLADLD